MTHKERAEEVLRQLEFRGEIDNLDEVRELVEKELDEARKRGLIDAAQAVCRRCRDTRPERGRGGMLHARCWLCAADEIIELLETAGGWQAEWPVKDRVSDKR